MKVIVLVGNPKPRSRTAAAGEIVARGILDAVGASSARVEVIDLADHVSQLFDYADEHVAALIHRIVECDLLVVASPTYKATYAGLLKVFLDRFANDGLSAVVAVPLMLGALPGHSLAIEVHLRPLLVELGASMPARGLYLIDTTVPDAIDEVLAPWLERNAPALRRALTRPSVAPGD